MFVVAGPVSLLKLVACTITKMEVRVRKTSVDSRSRRSLYQFEKRPVELIIQLLVFFLLPFDRMALIRRAWHWFDGITSKKSKRAGSRHGWGASHIPTEIHELAHINRLPSIIKWNLCKRARAHQLHSQQYTRSSHFAIDFFIFFCFGCHSIPA